MDLEKTYYRKVLKFSDTRKHYCNLPKIQMMEPNLRVFRQNDANGIANSEDPDQSGLGLHCLLRPICPKTYVHYGNCIFKSKSAQLISAFVFATKIVQSLYFLSISDI